ncbi:MAG: hypothetical protein AAFV07_16125, partial [Bacteroidota bacterium]
MNTQMNLKSYILIFFAILLTGPAVQAQDEMRGVRQEQIESFKIAFYTRRLDLTTEEAQVFWPVFNAYSDDLDAVRKEGRQLQVRMRQAYATASDREIEQMSDEYIGLKRKELEVIETYHQKFKSVLPVRKVILLYKVENDFK